MMRGHLSIGNRLAPEPLPTWTFLSSHAHVLLCLARAPDLRIRDLARLIGITERAVQRILLALSTGGYLSVTKDGRRNHYTICVDLPLRHPVEGGVTIRELVHLVEGRALLLEPSGRLSPWGDWPALAVRGEVSFLCADSEEVSR